ncbi:nonstructural protein 7 [Tylonycteris bat coronavirus HKU33]|uniref:Nonstructural protein 7 n=1 Tax=Tylonycteris bat coronavirus HKU33 TaxID=2586420 RepID=A0AAE6F8T5_9ALPC|nr:nonstructural protein 7 [Tylonycteris bat coronavirus HKU33]QCX35165.1 nonstructural protein 7 [Tylonycteris bat coronavirus HKU33]
MKLFLLLLILAISVDSLPVPKLNILLKETHCEFSGARVFGNRQMLRYRCFEDAKYATKGVYLNIYRKLTLPNGDVIYRPGHGDIYEPITPTADSSTPKQNKANAETTGYRRDAPYTTTV